MSRRPDTEQRHSREKECDPAAILADGRRVRLTPEGGRWAVFAVSPQGPARLGVLGASVVESLRQRGHLVDCPQGGLEPLRQRESSSGRLTAQRPGRPKESATIAVVNEAESPLAWLRSRRDRAGRPLISDEQYRAGERLRSDFERAMLAKRVTANWDITAAAGRGGSNTPVELSDGAIAARQRFHAAMDAVGPELGSILLQVCCLAAGIEQAERLLELPQRSGKAVLGLALAALVRHFGFGSRRGAAIHEAHWAMPSSRPAVQELEDA